MANFIRTTDKETANTLLSLGFEQIPDTSGCYLFINKDTVCFDKESMPEHCVYTNVLFMDGGDKG